MLKVMHLTNGTMQINFFKDHTKVCIHFKLLFQKRDLYHIFFKLFLTDF